MYSYLLKQISGLYNIKSQGDKNFISNYYNFKEEDSNPEAILGENISFKYTNNNITFITDITDYNSGSFLVFVDNTPANELQMVKSTDKNSVENDLLDCCETYGAVIITLLYCVNNIPFQPIPSDGGHGQSDDSVQSEQTYVVNNSPSVSQLALQRTLNSIVGLHYDNVLDLHGVLIEALNGMTDCTDLFNQYVVDEQVNRMDFAYYTILPTPDNTDYTDVPVSVDTSVGVISGALSYEQGAYSFNSTDYDKNIFLSVAVLNSNDSILLSMGVSASTQVLLINAKPNER